MNELEAIKDHHDSLPGPAPEVTARARVLLAEEAGAEPRRLTVAAPGRGRPARSPRRPLRVSRLAMRAGAAVGLAAAVTAGLVLVRGGHDSAPFGTPPASAAELLRHAASVAAREDVRPGPGQFVYVDQRNVMFVSSPEGAYTQEWRREVWMPAGDPGKALTRSTYGRTRLTGGGGPAHVQPPGTVEYQRAGQCHESPLALLSQATDLPADPDQALARIRRDAEVFVRSDQRRRGETDLGQSEIDMRVEKIVGGLLLKLAENPLTPSQTRATVFGALSKMPSATVVPDLTDPAGRHGVGASLRYESPGTWERGELIFEPVTYRFLGYRSWIGRQEGGQVKEIPSSSMAVMAVKVVGSMPKVPKDAAKPMFC
ncbi:CU044_5270 family protein [Sphaerisporangium corydalis]|uniref:CU044_5270 family protein n=1 Tax=Sphaerisporangium corydalis TaxID=1441875 RepID=A0ABV9EEJ5_9ACTN|nr:CU044_5270 family protein [Sphaerisporangium corydalis]